jgi:glycosyltransferase involved in cell wall biosynthesis
MKLILVDPHVVHKSPTMGAWMKVFPRIRHLFDEIEVWAMKCEIADHPGVVWRRIPHHFPQWPLQAMEYEHRVRRLQSEGKTKGALVQVTGCYLDQTDIRYIQYWNRAYLEESRQRPETLKLSRLQKLFAGMAARREKAVSVDPHSTKSWWVVSHALGARIAKDGGGGGTFEVLPNQYDPSRFNPNVKDTWRAKMRAHYGFADTTQVFAFSSFGHFERKGLLQAVEALAILYQKGHDVKFLILGGLPKTIAAFKEQLNRRNVCHEFCIFTGLVTDIQNHLCAADAFLFPSHFEAFSLAEIEAGALGLRLYLTPHYGTEMILREPENGRFLPWDVAGMAAVLEQDLANGDVRKPHHQLGDALNPDQYADRLIRLYEKAIERKLR